MVRQAARMKGGRVVGCSSHPLLDRHTNLNRPPMLTEASVSGLKSNAVPGGGGGDVQDAVSSAIVQRDGG